MLWLGLIVTGVFATFGALEYIGDYYGGGYRGYSEGTYANGTTIECGGFTSCGAENSYHTAIQKKGIVIAVGAAMSFTVL